MRLCCGSAEVDALPVGQVELSIRLNEKTHNPCVLVLDGLEEG